MHSDIENWFYYVDRLRHIVDNRACDELYTYVGWLGGQNDKGKFGQIGCLLLLRLGGRSAEEKRRICGDEEPRAHLHRRESLPLAACLGCCRPAIGALWELHDIITAAATAAVAASPWRRNWIKLMNSKKTQTIFFTCSWVHVVCTLTFSCSGQNDIAL